MVYLLIIVGLAILFFVIFRKFKFPKTGNFIMIDGAVKSGKTTFAYSLARKIYKRNVRSVKIRNFFGRIFCKFMRRPFVPEEQPLFYSTIPVGIPHVLLTKELLLRSKRFNYKSVIFVDEASLFADSTLVKNYKLNDDLLLFCKLIAHETKGGSFVVNSQSISDVHFSIRRCLSESYYVHKTYKWIPFFLVCEIREERYREDNQSINVYDGDVEESLKRVLIPKKVWKEFDCYCYSIMTDHLSTEDRVIKAKSLKARQIISFNPDHCIDLDRKEG